ncbi:MAG: sodium-dependent bicarbonate transport family permease, partial [Bacteroidetes bacterium]
MFDSPLLSNLMSPPILFFLLGLVAVLIRSDLEIPGPVARFLSLYLLMAIGFKGGAELAHSGLSQEVLVSLGLAIGAALVVPLYTFVVLRRRVGVANAGAIAATYGSVSAVTFVTATAFLQASQVPFGGHMVAAMALMESPAIIVGVALVRAFNKPSEDSGPAGSGASVLKEAFTNGSVVMILGSLVVGLLV